jgi:hypothetical protein
MGLMSPERFILRGSLGGFLDEIDDFCGSTGRPHPPVPHIPWLQEILVGVAVARLAATLDKSALTQDLAKVGSALVASGLKNAGSDPMPGVR